MNVFVSEIVCVCVCKYERIDTTECVTDLDLGNEMITLSQFQSFLNWVSFLEAAGTVV